MHEKKAYEKTILEERCVKAEDILSGALDEEIRSRFLQVIEKESPIVEALLCKRMLNSLSIAKMGCRLEEHLRPLLSALPVRTTIEGGNRVYWKDDNAISYFRTSSSELRYSYQIPVSEAVNAILLALENCDHKMGRSELIQAFAENLDYQKKGSQVQLLFTQALKAGVDSGSIKSTKNYRYYI